MQVQKRTPGQRSAAILTIIWGAFTLIAGLLMYGYSTVIGLLFGGGFGGTPNIPEHITSMISTVTVIGTMMAAVGLAMIILGSMFCRTKPQKVIAYLILVSQVAMVGLGIWLGIVLNNITNAVIAEVAPGTSVGTPFSGGFLDYIVAALVVVFVVLHIVQADKVYGSAPTQTQHTQTQHTQPQQPIQQPVQPVQQPTPQPQQ